MNKVEKLKIDVQGMREKILDLAMRGKLVSQDENDEPVNVLLEKIAREKAQLIKEKKIKKIKPLPEITDEEKPFDIPDSWEWVRLGDVGNYIQRGRSPKYDKEKHAHPIISQKCIQWDFISLKDAKFVTEEFWNKLESYRFLQKNDILWNSTGTGTVGRVNIVKEDLDRVPVDSHVTLIRMNNNLIKDYIYYYLRAPYIQKNLGDYLTGTTKQKELGLSNILKVMIPLPPLNEQKRIVAKVEELFKLLDIVEESTNSYENLQKELKEKILELGIQGKLVKQDPDDESASVLYEKIQAEKAQLIKEKKIKKTKPLPEITDEEKPFDIPDSWKWVRIGNIGDVQTGNTPSKKDSSLYNGSIPFIKPANISKNGINYNTEEYLTTDGVKKGRIANRGTILITCIGNLGRNFYIDRKVAFNQQINSIYPFFMISGLLHYFLESNFFVNTMYRDASATTLPILNKSKLSHLLLPLPPLNEQKRIATKIEELFNTIDN